MLYALAEDPGEERNLSEERSQTRDELRARLTNYLKTVYAARSDSGRGLDLDENLKRRLESLGYVFR